MDRIAAARAIDAFLLAIGRDPRANPELAHTGQRVASAFIDDRCAGYAVDVRTMLRAAVLPSQANATNLIVAHDLPIRTTCPHHLTLAHGTASIGFMPTNGRIVGIGTLADLAHACARRLALQEQIGEDIVNTLLQELEPSWAACTLVMDHGCTSLHDENQSMGPSTRPSTQMRVKTMAIAGTQGGWSRAEIMAALGCNR